MQDNKNNMSISIDHDMGEIDVIEKGAANTLSTSSDPKGLAAEFVEVRELKQGLHQRHVQMIANAERNAN